MGVIQRQSLKYTFVNFTGTLIGFLSVVFVYSLDKELYGYFQSVFSFATLLVTILGFGIQGLIIKYHPDFVQKGKQAHFLSFTVVVALVSSLISSGLIAILYTLFKPALRSVFQNFSIVEDNVGSIMLLSFILLFSSIFIHHAAARYRIVIPDLILNVGLKIMLPTTILLVYFGYLSRAVFMPVMLGYFICIAALLFLYLLTLDSFKIRPAIRSVSQTEARSMLSFMVFAVLNGLGAAFALKIDLAMIGMMISKEAVGVYAIIMTITNVMEIPLKAIAQISGPVVSSNWVNRDTANIQDVYQKSSVFGALGGVYLFLLLYGIWPDILQLMPGKLGGYQEVILIFAFLGGARLIDLMTGINSVILSYSDQYRVHMYLLIILGSVNVVFNYLWLNQYGLPGAAAATFASYLVFNGLKYLYVRYKFGFYLSFQPHLVIIGSGILVFACLSWVKLSFHPVVNMGLMGILITLSLGLLYWLFNPENIRQIFLDSIRKYKLR